jgi:hypothetical protein
MNDGSNVKSLLTNWVIMGKGTFAAAVFLPPGSVPVFSGSWIAWLP